MKTRTARQTRFPSFARNGGSWPANLAGALLALALVLFPSFPAPASEYIRLEGLIDTRTTFSDGELDLESLLLLARKKGFDFLCVNDHDRLALEYGVWPLRNILKKRVELNSINRKGARRYLEAIRTMQEKYPEMILLPGSETVPFYYWSGSYFGKDLTANDHEKRILTIGMERPEDYECLPILHNGFSVRYSMRLLPRLVFFSGALALGIVLLRWKGFYRTGAIAVSALSLILIIDLAPFRSSPFDQYSGDQAMAPYQMVVDYVRARGGLTFWNYPETRSGIRQMGPILVNTPPYPEAITEAVRYTGFAAIYGDTITITEPGGLWDQALLEYCRGDRESPPWGISTADFHKEGGSGQQLGDFPTAVWVREKTTAEVLRALREGRMYACQGAYPQRPVCDAFYICDEACGKRAVSGQEITVDGPPTVHLSLCLKQPVPNTVTVRLIRSGQLLETYSGSLPMQIRYEDKYLKKGRKVYYRIDMGGHGVLLSNPIFVVRE